MPTFPTPRLSKLAATLRFEAFQRRVQCQRSVSRGREGGHAPAQVIGSIDFIETECGIALLENSGATQVAQFIRQLILVMMLDDKQTAFG
jgi:hypothetical protein